MSSSSSENASSAVGDAECAWIQPEAAAATESTSLLSQSVANFKITRNNFTREYMINETLGDNGCGQADCVCAFEVPEQFVDTLRETYGTDSTEWYFCVPMKCGCSFDFSMGLITKRFGSDCKGYHSSVEVERIIKNNSKNPQNEQIEPVHEHDVITVRSIVVGYPEKQLYGKGDSRDWVTWFYKPACKCGLLFADGLISKRTQPSCRIYHSTDALERHFKASLKPRQPKEKEAHEISFIQSTAEKLSEVKHAAHLNLNKIAESLCADFARSEAYVAAHNKNKEALAQGGKGKEEEEESEWGRERKLLEDIQKAIADGKKLWVQGEKTKEEKEEEKRASEWEKVMKETIADDDKLKDLLTTDEGTEKLKADMQKWGSENLSSRFSVSVFRVKRPQQQQQQQEKK